MWFYIIIILAAIILVSLFLFALKIRLVMNTDTAEIKLAALWLEPLVKAFVTIENSVPVLQVFIFRRFILKKTLKRKKKSPGGMELVKLTNPKDIRVSVGYGFRDPFATGITCGVINMASQFINIDSVEQTPDFLSSTDYIYLDATARVNVGMALVKLLSHKKS